MPRHGENIYRRKDGRWEGRYCLGRKPDGRAIYKSVYGKYYREVKKELLLRKAEMLTLPSNEPGMGRDTLFEERAVYYLEYKAKPFVKESTLMGYQRMLTYHLIPAFGAIPLNRLTTETLQCYFSKQMERLADSTLRNIFSLLRAILNDAYLDGRIVCRMWENVRLPRRKKPNVRVFAKEEQIAFERMAIKEGRVEFILCLYTGLRLGELCALQWEDVDWQEQKLIIRHSLQRVTRDGRSRVLLGTPKSHFSQREIPMPSFVYDMLRILRERASAEARFIFAGNRGEFCDMRTMQARFKRLTDKLQIQGAHVHTLRHSFATRCLEYGIGIETLSVLLGHSSATITLRYYVHSTKERRFESVRDFTLLSA